MPPVAGSSSTALVVVEPASTPSTNGPAADGSAGGEVIETHLVRELRQGRQRVQRRRDRELGADRRAGWSRVSTAAPSASKYGLSGSTTISTPGSLSRSAATRARFCATPPISSSLRTGSGALSSSETTLLGHAVVERPQDVLDARFLAG